MPHERFDDGYFEENRIFERVFRWIETLYRLIQPAKLFYLASDGVAPCAKWRTQRLRRYDNFNFRIVFQPNMIPNLLIFIAIGWMRVNIARAHSMQDAFHQAPSSWSNLKRL